MLAVHSVPAEQSTVMGLASMLVAHSVPAKQSTVIGVTPMPAAAVGGACTLSCPPSDLVLLPGGRPCGGDVGSGSAHAGSIGRGRRSCPSPIAITGPSPGARAQSAVFCDEGSGPPLQPPRPDAPPTLLEACCCRCCMAVGTCCAEGSPHVLACCSCCVCPGPHSDTLGSPHAVLACGCSVGAKGGGRAPRCSCMGPLQASTARLGGGPGAGRLGPAAAPPSGSQFSLSSKPSSSPTSEAPPSIRIIINLSAAGLLQPLLGRASSPCHTVKESGGGVVAATATCLDDGGGSSRAGCSPAALRPSSACSVVCTSPRLVGMAAGGGMLPASLFLGSPTHT